MRTFKSILFGALLCAGIGMAQTSQAQTVLDGAYIKEHTKTQRVVPYPYIREADVMWYRRVWREIDLREKINLPLYYPTEPINDRKSLFDVIKQGVLEDGSITAYDVGPVGLDDEFTKPLLPSEVKAMLSKTDTTMTDNIYTGELDTVYTTSEVTSEKVRKYLIKEDWIFDRQRSVMDIRIIGLCPLRENIGEDGEMRGYSKMFWLYFPELRYVLVNWDVFNRENDAERRSFDHVFWARQFNSTITKVGNVYDRNIAQYKTGIDALLEGEAIKEDLFNFEHDLWNF
ncbi:MAG: gliding motility protein GldN [Flavobacteriales bacterium]|jgi:gliding motility associated protien GldN|nr:gliding motility protein GldN [Flavobacteriales bacterium]MCB0758273.1 gliding motility protein GldN [Flavobacteriales bacterium]